VSDAVATNDVFERASALVADVPLNIIESSQIWPSLRSLTTSLPNMAKNWRDLRKFIRTGSSGFLAWKFGVSPILNDLSNIAKFAPDIRRQFERHKRSKPTRTSKVYPLNPTFGLNGYSETRNGFTVLLDHYQGIAQGTCEVRYVIVHKPNVPQYQSDAFASLDFVLKRFTTTPAQLAWERIPFSFMLDWFVDVRGALRKVDESLGIKPFDIISSTKSITYSLATDAFKRLRNSKTGGQISDSKTGSVSYKHYERSVLPTGRFWPSWKSRFGKNQAAITAALIGQKLR
jgi:hypothetical protein